MFLSAVCVTGLVAQEAANPRFDDPPPPPPGAAPAANNAPDAAIPANLTLPSGSFVTVRVDQWLSSDRNQTGDTFYATLAQPVIVNGIVVARKGSTVMGRVSDAQKAGRVQGTSKLGLQLTSLSLVDGSSVPVQSQVIDRNGRTSTGSDAAAIGATTGVGAAIGATAAGGSGAAIGAGAGAIASTIGVLLTRGRPTEIYPETMLTFRLDSPVTISTAQAPAAFHYADQQDYGTSEPRLAQQRPPRPAGPPPAVYGAPYPYAYPYYSPYYGPGLSVWIGPGYYGRGYYRGFRRW
ncbi:MAG TPA: hypothetical protein VHC90_20495 [Bryobacteraceae bacterium]|nr:hypothetical protein [Bryobacteraceae bacterium]